MLPKGQRINTKRFNEIIASGRNINAGGFYVKTLSNKDVRFAVAVPKKVCKGAIKRHLVKRKILNALKGNISLFPTADYIIFINKEAIDYSREQILENIKNMAQKLDYK